MDPTVPHARRTGIGSIPRRRAGNYGRSRRRFPDGFTGPARDALVMADTDIDDFIATTDEGLREQAMRRVKKRRDLHTHAFVYLTVNVLVWGVWLIIADASDSWFPWPLWLTLGWGIGLIFNAWDVYVRRPITETDVQREVERLRHQHLRGEKHHDPDHRRSRRVRAVGGRGRIRPRRRHRD
jgi:2TM domain